MGCDQLGQEVSALGLGHLLSGTQEGPQVGGGEEEWAHRSPGRAGSCVWIWTSVFETVLASPVLVRVPSPGTACTQVQCFCFISAPPRAPPLYAPISPFRPLFTHYLCSLVSYPAPTYTFSLTPAPLASVPLPPGHLWLPAHSPRGQCLTLLSFDCLHR